MTRRFAQTRFLIDLRGVSDQDWDHLQSELKNVTSGGATPQQLANARPDQLGNDPKVCHQQFCSSHTFTAALALQMEIQWAEQAGKHAETYMNLLKIVKDKKKLRLTKCTER